MDATSTRSSAKGTTRGIFAIGSSAPSARSRRNLGATTAARLEILGSDPHAPPPRRFVPKRQILLLNFDDLSADASDLMERVADFLQLAPFRFKVTEAHNTHRARSVHVAQKGASSIEQV